MAITVSDRFGFGVPKTAAGKVIELGITLFTGYYPNLLNGGGGGGITI